MGSLLPSEPKYNYYEHVYYRRFDYGESPQIPVEAIILRMYKSDRPKLSAYQYDIAIADGFVWGVYDGNLNTDGWLTIKIDVVNENGRNIVEAVEVAIANAFRVP